MRWLSKSVAVIGLAGVVSACGGTAQTLGLTPEPPDEFQVVRKAPLSLPPNYSLRPPAPGQQRPQELIPTESAKKSVFRLSDRNVGQVTLPEGEARGQAAFLARAGANEARSDIREVLEQERGLIADASRTFLDELLFWQDDEAQDDRTLIDANAERKRLQENEATGRSPDEGDNPILIERNAGSIFSF